MITLEERPPILDTTAGSLWQVFTVLGVMVMEVTWITLLYLLVINSDLERTALPVYLFVAMSLLMSFWLARILEFLRLTPAAQRVSQVVLLVLLIAVGLLWVMPYVARTYPGQTGDGLAGIPLGVSFLLSPHFLTGLAVVLIWRRGTQLARTAAGPLAVQRTFRTGLLVFLFVGLIGSGIGSRIPTIAVLLFLLAALISMASARLSSLSVLRGGRGVPFDRSWLMNLTVMAVLVVLVVGVAALFAGTVLSEVVARLFLGIIGVLAFLIMLILGPLIMLLLPPLSWLLEQFAAVISGVPLMEEAGLRMPDVEMLMEELAAETVQPAWVELLNSALTLLIIGAGIFLLAVIVLASLRQTLTRRRAAMLLESDQFSAIDSPSQFARAALQEQVERFADRISRLRPAGQLLAAFRIRLVYAKLMALSSRQGTARPRATTPKEFLPTLEETFPQNHDDLRTITDAYLRVRYGELPETQQEIDLVEGAWDRIRAQARSLRGRR
jgi:hypothetical protein